MAAALAARRATNNKAKSENQNHEPLSFHLELLVGSDFILPEGKNSVALLRWPLHKYDDLSDGQQQNATRPSEKSKSIFGLCHKRTIFESNPSNITGTKFEMWAKKFNNKCLSDNDDEKVWQDRLLIVTEKRLFIITKKINDGVQHRRASCTSETPSTEKHADKINERDLEIVDSIPMEEILSVEFTAENGQWPEDPAIEEASSYPVLFKKLFQHSVSLRMDDKGDTDDSAAKKETEVRDNIEEKVLSKPLSAEERDRYIERIMRITTKPGGFNRGNPYYFILRKDATQSKNPVGRKDVSVSDQKDSSKLMRRASVSVAGDLDVGHVAQSLSKLVAKRKVDFSRETRFIRLQAFLQEIWNSLPFNIAVLILIVSNFIFTVQQLENNDPTRQRFFETVDMVYTILFTIELSFNFLAHAFWPFVQDGWAIFDTVIVSVSVALLAVGTGGGNSWIKQLRVLRAFRLFRLLGKMGDLKKIVTAVAMSIAPTLQALLIGLIVIFIYAVFGLQFYADRSEASFGSFIRAVVTLFGVVSTLQGWPDDLPLLLVSTRNVSSATNETGMEGNSSSIETSWELDIGVIAFSFSFTVICLLILVQVVVAVLLDKFFQANQQIEEESIHSNDNEDEHPLDFVLKDIAKQFDDTETLDSLLNDLFNTFDVDGSGSLSFTEFAAGLNSRAEASLSSANNGLKKKAAPKLEDNYFKTWSADFELNVVEFKEIMSLELRKYLQRNTRRAERTDPAFEVLSTLQATRIMMVEQTKLQSWMKAEFERHMSDLLRQQKEMQEQQNKYFSKLQEMLQTSPVYCNGEQDWNQHMLPPRDSDNLMQPDTSTSDPVASANLFLDSLFGGGKKQETTGWANGSIGLPGVFVRDDQDNKIQSSGGSSAASPRISSSRGMNTSRDMASQEDTISGGGISASANVTPRHSALEPAGEGMDKRSVWPAKATTSAELGFHNPGNFDVLQWCFSSSLTKK